MKKKLLLSLLSLAMILTMLPAMTVFAAYGDIPIDEEHFPDPVFREYIAYHCDNDERDGVLSFFECSDVTVIDLAALNADFYNLQGIEFFPNLQRLFCGGQKLTNLNVSKNTALTYLDCSNNQLTSLDVGGCTALRQLYCSSNQLTNLNVRGCTELIYLDCSSNQLISLDVDDCTSLTYLWCDFNQLTNLDVNGCATMLELYCEWNQLTNLDVSDCTALINLHCYYNSLTNLDVSGCAALIELRSYGNLLTNLDVSNNTALAYLDCGSNQMTNLDVSGCTALTYLYCEWNQLTCLNISDCTVLTELDCRGNELSSLDVSNNTILSELVCSSNQLAMLDFSNNTNLTDVDIGDGSNVHQIILDEEGTFDLATIHSFDVSKASNWSGCTVDGTILTPYGRYFYYDYDCGQGITGSFALVIKCNCVDEDGDYWCDLCGEMFEHDCIDEDEDYLCDLCGSILDHECMDENGDYRCDVCDWMVDHECIDENSDWYCDLCDYWIYHECIDENSDYWCDLCEDWLYHECIDENGDYFCDLCGWWYSHDCIEKNGDYFCDLCGWPCAFGKHIDANGDFLCDYCGQKLTHTHEWKQIVEALYLKSAATCTEKAVYYYSCECGERGSDTFAYGNSLGHTEVVDATIAATCTATGLTEGKHCSVCSEVLVAQEEIAMLPHTYESGTCAVCGSKDPSYVPPGEVTDKVETADGVPAIDADIPADDILTEEDKAQIAQGENVQVKLVVSTESSVSDEDKFAITASLAEGMEVSLYLDIDLVKTVGNGTPTEVKETAKPVTITVEVPELLRGQNLVFSVIRVHNGETAALEDLDENPDTVTFATDRFSTYALVYEEGQSYTLGDVSGDGEINNFDLLLLLYHTNKRVALTEIQLLAADVTDDGKVNVWDIQQMVLYLNKRIDSLQ